MFEEITRYTLAVGLNDKDTHKQEIAREDAIAIIQNIVGDSTITDANGVYKNESERTLKIELLFRNDKQVIQYCDEIKKRLNQECVAVVKDKITSALI